MICGQDVKDFVTKTTVTHTGIKFFNTLICSLWVENTTGCYPLTKISFSIDPA